MLKMLKKNPFKLFWFFFTKFKKCAKNRQKISLNILGLICRIETEKRRPSSFKEYRNFPVKIQMQNANDFIWFYLSKHKIKINFLDFVSESEFELKKTWKLTCKCWPGWSILSNYKFKKIWQKIHHFLFTFNYVRIWMYFQV